MTPGGGPRRQAGSHGNEPGRTDRTRVWIRSEVRQTERRAPIVPADAGWLTSQGLVLTVEESPHRTFPVSDYAAAGCRIAPAGSWPGAPTGEYIIGLKELPEQPAALAHRHIYFGHAYKGQRGACQLLHRFAAGGGALLDLESLVDANGRRLAAFGFWAGYAGAALAILHAKGRLPGPLRPVSKEALDAALRATRDGSQPRVLVVGALRAAHLSWPVSHRPAGTSKKPGTWIPLPCSATTSS